MRFILFAAVALGGAVACDSPKKESGDTRQPVLVGLTGEAYFEPERSAAAQAQLDSNLQVARANFEAAATEENYIWYGRREAYLAHYEQAIEIFSNGIQQFPNSYRLYRHRGHRYIYGAKV
jgi:hypothetical protein